MIVQITPPCGAPLRLVWCGVSVTAILASPGAQCTRR
jgi:hypothetical protein